MNIQYLKAIVASDEAKRRQYERRGGKILTSSFRDAVNEFIFNPSQPFESILFRLNTLFHHAYVSVLPLYREVAKEGVQYGKEAVLAVNARDRRDVTYKALGFNITVNWAQADQNVIDWLDAGNSFSSPYFSLVESAMFSSNENWLRREYRKFVNGEQDLSTTQNTLILRVFSRERADRIIRTNVTDIWAGGQQEAYRVSGTSRNQWLTRFDERVCPICSRLHGRTVTVGEEFIPLVTRPPAHVSCVLPDTLISFPFGVTAAFKSFYSGEVIEITLGSGRVLTCTKNHPILTINGVVSADTLTEGMNVFTSADSEWSVSSISPYNNHVPTQAQEVFSTLEKSSMLGSVRMPITAEYFYGDGRFMDCNIDVVYTDSFLLRNQIANINKIVGENSFSSRCFDQSFFKRDSTFSFNRYRSGGTFDSGVGCDNSLFPFLFGHIFPTNDHAFSTSSGRVTDTFELFHDYTTRNRQISSHLLDRNTGLVNRDEIFNRRDRISTGVGWASDNVILSQNSTNSSGANFVNVSNLFNRFSANIQSDNIVLIKRFNYTGHVYTFQSEMRESPVYISNTVLSNNCRCFLAPVSLSDEELAELIGGKGPSTILVRPKIETTTVEDIQKPRREKPAEKPVEDVAEVEEEEEETFEDLTPLVETDTIVTWGKEPQFDGIYYNGAKIESIEPGFWEGKEDTIEEPDLPKDTRISTGVVIVEKDGRVWVVEPTNHFGGYEHTFPKGGLEKDLTAQQNALKEVYEETGLSVELTGLLGDYEGTTGTTRYYVGKRNGGAPWDSDWETEKVKLVPIDQLEGLLNVQRDKNILTDLRKYLGMDVDVTETVPDEIPDISKLKKIKRLGGSTGATLYEDDFGNKYVVKYGDSEQHIRSEYLADELYRSFGANVPEARLFDSGNKVYKVARYVEGTLLSDLEGEEFESARKELQKHFATDALLGSWDVVGLDLDNIIVDPDGKVWRIDNGGSLLYRAQGGPKNLTGYMDELWSMRSEKINPSSFRIFGDTDYRDIYSQLKEIKRTGLEKISISTDREVTDILKKRLSHVDDLIQIYDTFKDDTFSTDYIDSFSEQNTWIQSTGLSDALPKTLQPLAPGLSELWDENGREFDRLRDTEDDEGNRISGNYRRFLEELTNRYDLHTRYGLTDWFMAQGESSWSGGSRAIKQTLEQLRPGNYFTYEEPDEWEREKRQKQMERFLDKFTFEDRKRFMAAIHAYTYEVMRRTNVGNQKDGKVLLYRTESDFVIIHYDVRMNQPTFIKRGALESFSLYNPIIVEGNHVTEQWVPFHRIFAPYFFGTDKTIFLNDYENEMLVLSDGVETVWTEDLRY